MLTVSHPVRENIRKRLSGAILALVALTIAASSADAGVTFDAQRRSAMAFTLVSIPGQENLFCTDEQTSLDSGVFAATIDCQTGEPGNQASVLSGQLSYITPQFFAAEGSFNAEAEISGEADFAEGLGSSGFTSEFSVDTPTVIHLTALITAAGNGSTVLVFRVKDGEILLYHGIHNDSVDVDEYFSLEPGSYEWSLSTSGAGQALPDGTGLPASGSFIAEIELPTASVTGGEPLADGRLAPLAVPNPLRNQTMLYPAGGANAPVGEIAVVDLSGRLIRRFSGVGPTGVAWDARDENGRPVAAGIYLVRGSGGTTTRAVVLR